MLQYTRTGQEASGYYYPESEGSGYICQAASAGSTLLDVRHFEFKGHRWGISQIPPIGRLQPKRRDGPQDRNFDGAFRDRGQFHDVIPVSAVRLTRQYEWYVDTILQLISAAGDHVGAEVWYRVVQLVTNNEDLQPYAAAAVYHHLQAASCHENMVKVGGQSRSDIVKRAMLIMPGYILGEFGHLIANEEGCSPIEQFQALHSKVNQCTAPTRALLLTTYVKVSHPPIILGGGELTRIVGQPVP